MTAAARVTVTVITYNHAAFIGSCIESALAQRCDFPFEVVVGDDASNDGTQDVVRALAARDPRVRPILQLRNAGVRQNWQAVLDASRGEYLAHLDGDDLMRPGKLQKQVAHLDAHPDLAMCFHNMRVFESATGRDLGVFTVPGTPPVRTLEEMVRHGTVYCHSSKMYRRSALPSTGLDAGTHLVMDWLTHLEQARHGGIGYLDEVLGDYRKHPQGATAVTDAARITRSLDDQLHTLERARAFGASPAALGAAEERVRLLTALQFLDGGHDAAFGQLLESGAAAFAAAGGARRVLYLLRRHPAACRVLARAYRMFYVMPRRRLAMSAS
jgi:glycosyltransferase involved in cell wall biosynthesis